jgi:hypothetical protein
MHYGLRNQTSLCEVNATLNWLKILSSYLYQSDACKVSKFTLPLICCSGFQDTSMQQNPLVAAPGTEFEFPLFPRIQCYVLLLDSDQGAALLAGIHPCRVHQGPTRSEGNQGLQRQLEAT